MLKEEKEYEKFIEMMEPERMQRLMELFWTELEIMKNMSPEEIRKNYAVGKSPFDGGRMLDDPDETLRNAIQESMQRKMQRGQQSNSTENQAAMI